MRILQKIIGAVRSRYTMLGLLTVLFALAAALRLFDLQIIRGGQYAQSTSAAARETRRITEIAPRGRIMDRNGAPIASNSEVFTVHIVRSPVFDGENGYDELNRVLLSVCEILEKNNDALLGSFGRYLTFADGKPAFVNPDGDANRTWQEKTLKLAGSALTADAAELFRYLRSPAMYDIGEDYDDADAYRIMSARYIIDDGLGAFDAGQSTLLARDVKPMSIAELQENSHNLGGIVVDTEPVRTYHDARYAAHVLGYTTKISDVQYEELKDAGYRNDEIVGQYGVEAQAEAYLHGRDGERRIELLTGGLTASQIDGRPATPGSDVVLTIDMELQRAAVGSLERNIAFIRNAENNGYMETNSKVNFLDAEAGAAVAVDVRTGEVLLMASVPTFDPSIFLGGAGDAEAQAAISALWADPLNASWNRAISGTYAPGSTFKPITAITALQEGTIEPHTLIDDPGHVTIGERNLFCLEGGHGPLDLKRALETSCNVFFYDIGYRSGIDNLEKWAKLFGLGVRTGIDLPFEREGTMSSQAYKTETFGDIWRPADTAQVAIGQLYNLFTPLQMACYMASFANGGVYYKPYLTQKVIRYDGSTVREAQPEMRVIPVDPGNIEAIKDGMIASTTEIDGTATTVFRDFPFQVAGKTGTAETGAELEQTKSSNSLFVCYAPADDPQIAVAVVIEKGVWGSYAAPVARDILEVYFGLKDRALERDIIEDSSGAITP